MVSKKQTEKVARQTPPAQGQLVTHSLADKTVIIGLLGACVLPAIAIGRPWTCEGSVPLPLDPWVLGVSTDPALGAGRRLLLRCVPQRCTGCAQKLSNESQGSGCWVPTLLSLC